MLPRRERAAKYLAEQFSLPVYKQYQNNAAEQTKNAGDIDTFGGIFGVKKEDWQEFLKTEKAQTYYGTVSVAVNAALKTLNNDMGNVDARVFDPLSDKLFKEKNEINRYLLHVKPPTVEDMKPFIKPSVNTPSG